MRESSILARLDNADEIVGAPVALVVLLLTFGSLVAADAVLDVLRKSEKGRRQS